MMRGEIGRPRAGRRMVRGAMEVRGYAIEVEGRVESDACMAGGVNVWPRMLGRGLGSEARAEASRE